MGKFYKQISISMIMDFETGKVPLNVETATSCEAPIDVLASGVCRRAYLDGEIGFTSSAEPNPDPFDAFISQLWAGHRAIAACYGPEAAEVALKSHLTIPEQFTEEQAVAITNMSFSYQ